MLLYFNGKRIRIFCDISASWWFCDDIANALEVPAEALLSHMSKEERDRDCFVGDVVNHVSQWAGRPEQLRSYIRASLPPKDLETNRFISDRYLERLLEIYEGSPVADELKKWLTNTTGEVGRTVAVFDTLCANLNQYFDLSLALRHLLFALDGDTLKKQMERMIIEIEAALALLKFFKSSYEKDQLFKSS